MLAKQLQSYCHVKKKGTDTEIFNGEIHTIPPTKQEIEEKKNVTHIVAAKLIYP